MVFFSFIFIGSTHGFVDDFKKQEEIINKISPEIVLCEELQNIKLISKEDYENILKKKRISEMTAFSEVEKLIRLCYSKNIKLIGIDLLNYGFDNVLQEKVKNSARLSESEEKKLSQILRKREFHQLNVIKRYAHKSDKPVIIITGAWHLRTDSVILTNLSDYSLILPCNERGDLLIKPPAEGEKIIYCEKKWQ